MSNYRSPASLAVGLRLLDGAIESLFRFRSSVLAKSSGGDRRMRLADAAIDQLIEARQDRVKRIRLAGGSPALLAKIASDERRLAKVSGIVGPLAKAAGMRTGGTDPRQAQLDFTRRIERTLAETRPDEYHPERR
jgi:hypothetical protein